MLVLGTPPALASANVHAAEVFTTAASGTSHAIARNVDWHMVWRLALFGSVGAVLGAFLISHADTVMLRPFIAAYLLGMVSLSSGSSGNACARAAAPLRSDGC